MRSELELLCDRRGVKIESQYGGVEVPDGWTPGTHPYKVTLRYRGRQMTAPFFMGPAHEKEPTAADVLNCLCSDARSGEMTFEEFCSEFGYDSDSRKAENTWKQCERLGAKVRRLLGDEFDEFANAEH
jgi:hypothetical protein